MMRGVMYEFSVFVGETKKATVFAESASDAVAKFCTKYMVRRKGVWAMRVDHIQEVGK